MVGWRRALIVALLPPTLLASAILAFARDVPYQDEWVFARLVLKSFGGPITFADLWERHLDHRIFVPKALLLGLAHLTGWDTRWPIALSFVLAIATLGTLASLIRRSVSAAPWLVVAASVLSFSLAQWENWLWGWQINVFLATWCAVTAAWALDRFGARPAGVAIVVAVTAIATLSFGSGQVLVLLVPIGLLAGDGSRTRRVVAAGAVAAGGVWLANAAWVAPIATRPRLDVIAAPGVLLRFVVACLGAPLAGGDVGRATVAGGLGLAFVVAAAPWLWWRAPATRVALRPWLFLAAYGIASAAAVAYGRALTNVGGPMTSRYVGVTWPFWLAAAALAAIALPHVHGRGARVVLWLAIALGAVGVADGWRVGLHDAAAHARRVDEGRACAIGATDTTDGCLGKLCWDPRLVRDALPRLKALRTGPFRGGG